MVFVNDYPISAEIDQTVIDLLPEIQVTGFRLDIFDPSATQSVMSPAGVVEAYRERGLTVQSIADAPEIKAWRSVFSEFGIKPSTYKSSPEALARRFMKHGGLTTGIHLVDVYCAISAKMLAPLGAYDVERLGTLSHEPHIVLRRASPSDRFNPIGGRASDYPLDTGVPIYSVENTVLCWGFNVRDSLSTCLTHDSRSIIFVGEATSQPQARALDSAMRELRTSMAQRGLLSGPILTLNAHASRGSFEALNP